MSATAEKGASSSTQREASPEMVTKAKIIAAAKPAPLIDKQKVGKVLREFPQSVGQPAPVHFSRLNCQSDVSAATWVAADPGPHRRPAASSTAARAARAPDLRAPVPADTSRTSLVRGRRRAHAPGPPSQTTRRRSLLSRGRAASSSARLPRSGRGSRTKLVNKIISATDLDDDYVMMCMCNMMCIVVGMVVAVGGRVIRGEGRALKKRTFFRARSAPVTV